MTEALNVELGWSLDDLGLLEDFLFAEDSGLDQPMDVSMIDGFFCALVSGPRLLSPVQALAWVFDFERGEQEPALKDAAHAQQIMDVLMKQWNATAAELMSPDCAYEPLLGCRELDDGRQVFILDEWCRGYLLGMKLDAQAWMTLQAEQPAWFATLLLYGSEEGWRHMELRPPSDAEHEAATTSLAQNAVQIHRYWQAKRGEQSPSIARQPLWSQEPMRGLDERCHCGSGRAYKLCHGGH
ncbi:UPF0149 family protein [Paucibacter sp. Y2R2-4]|uniref:UPF0149 family protein n=1 Tax=Paucibacter sp. Y2R2-4 TaxID=2893553 RepID=UPI0021E4F656|nr:UPF0149 family protein [Paucibacter sp. Y2R2-4]MCV2350603.1 UPF0149 family protein [Paucibacter sp. Y2R2-4]